MKILLRSAALAAVALLAGAGPLAAQPSSTLPGGASALQETYQDWTVACQIAEAAKLCAATQQQSQQNGQRLLAIEFVTAPADALTGNLVLPFGLVLDAGATLQIDAAPAQASQPFSTCLPAGCIVPLHIDAPTTAALRGATTLKLGVKAIDSGEQLTLPVSLKGLAAALDRMATLLAD